MYTVRIFMKCTHVCALTLYQIINKTRFPFLIIADEIAKPRPDKVAAFTVSEKSSNNKKQSKTTSLPTSFGGFNYTNQAVFQYMYMSIAEIMRFWNLYSTVILLLPLIQERALVIYKRK